MPWSTLDPGALAQIVWVDLVLCADNAIAIGLVVRKLPEKHRRLGIVVGAGIALVARILFTVFVGSMLSLAGMRLIGGAVLLLIAASLVADVDTGSGGPNAKSATSLPRAIGLILLADISMSLDNVLAIAAIARDDYTLLIIGLAISIVLLITCSSFLARLMQRWRLLVIAAGLFLAWTGAQLAVDDRLLAACISEHDWLRWIIGALAMLLLLPLVKTISRRRQSQVATTERTEPFSPQVEGDDRP